MNCGCCGVKKKLFTMFYTVGKGDGKVSLCWDCWSVTDKMKEDRDSGEWELYGLHQLQLQKRAKNPSQAFLTWKQENFPE